MLNLIFQRKKADDYKKVRVDSRSFFNLKKQPEWFADKFVQQIIKEVDHAEYVDGFVLRNEEGIVIPPEYLSTGSKTAICVYEFPDLIFNATQMGDNALKFPLILSMYRDVTLLTYRMLPYGGMKNLQIQKDYQPVTFTDNLDWHNKFDAWLEEMYND